jgi:hypothetical protein
MTTVERHERTQAAKTTTPTDATMTGGLRSAPTVKQVLADQKPTETLDRDGNRRALVTRAPAAPLATSQAAIERHLDEWAGPAGRLLAFNGADGFHKTLDDGNEMELPRQFIAHLQQLSRGYIKFNQGEPPTVAMRGIAEDAPEIEREDLGDTDSSLWPISEFTNQPDDPWKSQYTFPLISRDDAAEIFVYVARGPVAENSVRSLLGKWRYHPKRRQGLLPVVELSNGTYYSKRFKADRPKPEFKIVEWISSDDMTPAPAPLSLKDEMNDDLPF